MLTIVTGSGGRADCHPAHEHCCEAALICQNGYYFHMARQISSEMFLIRGSGESAPRGWRFSKMRAEGGLRGRLGAHTDDFQEKKQL